jgi:hypothetical protein
MVDVGVPRPFHNHSLIAELDHLVLLNMREKNPALYLNQIWSLHKKRFVRERKEKEESYVVYLRP